ncbi:hypothetical protein BD410DRAFT_822977 [Rickenella mellea]|uniref:Ras modification protein ERF4 n=1 Tax=Rickenella mellea TaxID=50990 RepID=A0A4Y7PMN2_9AGAM|nr:hypothetical protein BD410DRAFT_822977 [Rickenella mellea]
MSEATHMHLKANPATPSWTDDDPLRKPSSSLSPLSQTPLQQVQQPEHHNPLAEISAQPKDVVTEPVESIIEPDATTTAVSQDALKRARKVSTVRPKIPHSSYYFGPPPPDAAYGTPPCGHFGLHHPREIIRVERDYSGGELVQFSPSYPLELEGRITPTQFLETINAINELLISAHSLTWSFVDNTTAILSLYLTRLLFKSHYDKEMLKLKQLLDRLNTELYHPRGLHILWPRNVAFLFLEIEYY